MTTYINAALFAIAGIALGSVNAWNNAVQVNGGAFELNDLTAVVAGLAIAGAMLSMSLASIAQRSRMVAALAVIAIAGCIATSVGFTLGRIGSVADAGAEKAEAHNAQYWRAKSDIKRLGPRIEKQRQVEALECRGFNPERDKPKIWPKCFTARGLLAAYEKDHQAASASLASLGSRKVVDPAGERLEAVFGGIGITADGYRTAHPVIVAGTLELGVSLLLTIAGLFGATGRHEPRIIEGKAIDITPPDPVTALLQREGRALSNREVADRLGITPSAASQRVKLLADAGSVSRERIGRTVAIRLNA